MNRNLRFLLKYFDAQRATIDELGPKVFNRPSRKAIHRLRIATRRSRATLWVLKHSSPHLYFDRLDKRLRKLGQVLGAVRELDMAIKDAKKYNLDPTNLRSKRKVQEKSLHRYLKDKIRLKLSREMATAMKAVRSQRGLQLGPASRTLRSRMSCWQKRRLHGSTRLHRFRIAIKKTRYILEALGKPVEPMSNLQDLLGKAHDLETLQLFIGKNKPVKRDQATLAAAAIRLARPTLRNVNRQIDSSRP